MDAATAKISFVENAVLAMEERGITEEDVRAAITWSEGEGGKLIGAEGGWFLGKKRLEKFTVYAQYAIEGDEISVCSAYSHRVNLREDG